MMIRWTVRIPTCAILIKTKVNVATVKQCNIRVISYILIRYGLIMFSNMFVFSHDDPIRYRKSARKCCDSLIWFAASRFVVIVIYLLWHNSFEMNIFNSFVILRFPQK